MATQPVEPDGATPEKSPCPPISKPKRVKTRAAALRLPDFTVESLEGRDPPNNFQMLYDMALEAMLHADDYTQVSFASAPNRRPWQADDLLEVDIGVTSTPHLNENHGGGFPADPASHAAAVDLFVGLAAGRADLAFVQGVSGFDYGGAVFAGAAVDESGARTIAARPGGDNFTEPGQGDLAAATIATSQILSQPQAGGSVGNLDSIGQADSAADSAGQSIRDAGGPIGTDAIDDAGTDDGSGDSGGDSIGTRTPPPSGGSIYDGVTLNLHDRFANDISGLASRYSSETSSFSVVFASGYANASSHFSQMYGPTSGTSPYDVAASAAYTQYTSLADQLRSQFTAFSSSASSDVARESSNALSEFSTATSDASARYLAARNAATSSFTSLIGAHNTEALYSTSASAAFYGTILPAADGISSSALSRAASHFTGAVTAITDEYAAAMTDAASQFSTALANAEALFTEMTTAGRDSDNNARAAASAAYSAAADIVEDARDSLMSRATGALTNASNYAWSLYDDAMSRARDAYDGASALYDAAYNAATSLTSRIATTNYSATAYGDPASREDVEAGASAISSSAQGQRDAIDAAINGSPTSSNAINRISAAASAANQSVGNAVGSQFGTIGSSYTSLANGYSSNTAATTGTMTDAWNTRANEISAWLTGTLDPYASTSLASSYAAATAGSAGVTNANSDAFASYSSYYTSFSGATTGAGSGPGALGGWPSAPSTFAGGSTSLASVQEAFATWLPGLRTRVGADPTQYLVTQPDGPNIQLFVVAAELPASALTTSSTTYVITVSTSGTTSAGDGYTLNETVYVKLERTVDPGSGAFSAHALYLVPNVSYAETHVLTHSESWNFLDAGATMYGTRATTETVSFGATGGYWFDLSATGTSAGSITVASYSFDERRDLQYTLGQTGTATATWSATRAADNERSGYTVSGANDATWTNGESGTYREWNLFSDAGLGGYAASSSYDSGLTATGDGASLSGGSERGIWISSTRSTANNLSTAHASSTVTQSQTWTHGLGGTTQYDTAVDKSSITSIAKDRGDDVCKYVNYGSYVLTAFRFQGGFEFGGVAANTLSSGTESLDTSHHNTATLTQSATATHSETLTLLQSATANRLTSSSTSDYRSTISNSSTVSSTITASDIVHSTAAFSLAHKGYLLQKSYTMVSQTDSASGGTYLRDAWNTLTYVSTMAGSEGHNLTQSEHLTRPASSMVWQGAFDYSASATNQTGNVLAVSASSSATLLEFESAPYGRAELRASMRIPATLSVVADSATLDFRMLQDRPSMSAGTVYSTVTYSGGERLSKDRSRGFTKGAVTEGDTVTVSYTNEYDSMTYAQKSSESLSQSATATASASSSGIEYAKQNYSSQWDYDQLGFKHFYDDVTEAVTVSHARSEHATNTLSNTVTANLGSSQTASINGTYYQRSSTASQSHSETGSASQIFRAQGAADAIDFGAQTHSSVAGNINVYDPYVTTKEFAFALVSNTAATATTSPYTTLPDATAANLATVSQSQWNQTSISSTDSSTFIDKHYRPDMVSSASGGSTAKLVTQFNPLGVGTAGPVTPAAQWETVVEKLYGVDWRTPGVASAFAVDRFAADLGTDTAAGTWLADVSSFTTQSQTNVVNGPTGVSNPVSASYGEVVYGLGQESFTASNSLTEKITPGGGTTAGNFGHAIDFGSYVMTRVGRWVQAGDDLGAGSQTQTATHTGFANALRTATAVQHNTDVTSATASFNATSTATPSVPTSTSATEVSSTGTNWQHNSASQLALQTAFATDIATQTDYAIDPIFDFGSGTATSGGFVWSNVSGAGTGSNSATQTFTSHDIGTSAYNFGSMTGTGTAASAETALGLDLAAGSGLWRSVDDDIAVNRQIHSGSALNYASQSNNASASEATSGTWSLNRKETYVATMAQSVSGHQEAGNYGTQAGTAYGADAGRAFDVAFGSAQPTAIYVASINDAGNSHLANVSWVASGTTTGGTMTESPILFTNLFEDVTASWSHTASEAGRQSNYQSYHVAEAENYSLSPVNLERALVSNTVVVSTNTTTNFYPSAQSVHLAEGGYDQTHTFNQTGDYTTVPTDHPFAGRITRQLTTQFHQHNLALGSGSGSDSLVLLGNLELGTATQTGTVNAWDIRSGTTSLGLTESGSFSRTLPGPETQTGTFESTDVETHGFNYIGRGVYVTTQVSGLLGGHANWSQQKDDSTLSAAGRRTGTGTSTFTASGSLTIPSYTVGTVGTLTLATTSASASGSFSITDSATFTYSEANFDVAVAHATGDYFYGIFDASDRSASDTARQAFSYSKAGQSTYGKAATIAGGATGSFTLRDVNTYSDSTKQMRLDSDATHAIRLDGEHLTSAAHTAEGSLVHAAGNRHSHSFQADASYSFSGAGSGTMHYTELGSLDYKLTDAYDYTDLQNRLDERSWSVGTTVPTVTTSFVVHNSQKDQGGVLWQSESASYEYSMAASRNTSGAAPIASSNTLLSVPTELALLYTGWGDDNSKVGIGMTATSFPNSVHPVIPEGAELREFGAYGGWFGEQPSPLTSSTSAGTSCSDIASESYWRIDYNNILANYDRGTATFGFEDATPSLATVVNAYDNRTDTNVASQSMSDSYREDWPYWFKNATRSWQDVELDEATVSSASFSINGVSSSTTSLPASISQDFSIRDIPGGENPGGSYYVQSNEGTTIANTATNYSLTSDSGSSQFNANTISNGTTDTVRYGDVAEYDRHSISLTGLLEFNGRDEHIEHTFENSTLHRSGYKWDVNFIRTYDVGRTSSSYFSGYANDATLTASDYFRTADFNRLTMTDDELSFDYTYSSDSGVHRNDRVLSFTQNQNWTYPEEHGFRYGGGASGTFNGAAYGDAGGVLDEESLSEDIVINAVREIGHRDPVSFSVEWTVSNTSQLVSALGSVRLVWPVPTTSNTTTGGLSPYITTYGSTETFSATHWLKTLDNEPYHVSSNIEITDGATTTHSSMTGSGSFTLSHSQSASFSFDRWRIIPKSTHADTPGGSFDATDLNSARHTGTRYGMQSWWDIGSSNFSETADYYDGVIDTDSHSSYWHQVGSVGRSQTQTIQDSSVGTSKWGWTWDSSNPPIDGPGAPGYEFEGGLLGGLSTPDVVFDPGGGGAHYSFRGSAQYVSQTESAGTVNFGSTRAYDRSHSYDAPTWPSSGSHSRGVSATIADRHTITEDTMFSATASGGGTYSSTQRYAAGGEVTDSFTNTSSDGSSVYWHRSNGLSTLSNSWYATASGFDPISYSTNQSSPWTSEPTTTPFSFNPGYEFNDIAGLYPGSALAHPSWHGNLSFLSDPSHTAQTQRQTPDQLLLANQLPAKPPSQGSPFDLFGVDNDDPPTVNPAHVVVFMTLPILDEPGNRESDANILDQADDHQDEETDKSVAKDKTGAQNDKIDSPGQRALKEAEEQSKRNGKNDPVNGDQSKKSGEAEIDEAAKKNIQNQQQAIRNWERDLESGGGNAVTRRRLAEEIAEARRDLEQAIRANGGVPISVTALGPHPLKNKAAGEKFVAALQRAFDRGMIGDAAREQVATLLEPENLVKTGVFMGAAFSLFAAAHLTPVGWAADALAVALTAGQAGKVGADILEIYEAVNSVDRPSELDDAAKVVADKLTSAAGEAIIGFILKGIGKAAKGTGRALPQNRELNSKIASKANRQSGRNPTSSMTVGRLVDELRGTTSQADKIADAIASGEIKVNVLGDRMFKNAGGEAGDTAFVTSKGVYLRKGSPSIAADLVHEGTHALQIRELNVGERISKQSMELRARFFERQFQRTTGSAVDFGTIQDMITFVRENYDGFFRRS